MGGPGEHYSIEHERTDSHDHFYCADYEWRVIDTRTGECVVSFDESLAGGSATGVEGLALSYDGREVIVRHHDGRVEYRALPP